MNRRVIVSLLALAGVAAVALVINVQRPASPADRGAPTIAVPPAVPAAAPEPATIEPPASPAVVTRPSGRRSPSTKPDAPVPAPTPVADAPPTAGTLRIESDVPGAQVFIDREFIGATPVTASNVKPGSHRLNASVQGYDGYADTIDVVPGPREIRINFKEVRLDAHVDVGHKHGVGACKGRLVATPQGLRYDTTNKDDAFTVPLLDLDVFEVDYLAKNLKVKAKKGRQFNFTDPDGNADRLFEFQRDVAKAISLLRKG